MPGYTDYFAPNISVHPNNAVAPLINGQIFYNAVTTEMDKLLARTNSTGRFFYMTGWHMSFVKGPILTQSIALKRGGSVHGVDIDMSSELPFKPEQNITFVDKLIQMHNTGIDIRIMPWVSPYITNSQDGAHAAGGLWGQMIHNVMGSNKLIKSCGPGVTMLNTINHVLGAVHTKLIICGDTQFHQDSASPKYAVGFTSGIDPVNNRLANWWHDAGIRIEGPAVKTMCEFFYKMWKENENRGVDIKIRKTNTNEPSEVFSGSGGPPLNAVFLIPDLFVSTGTTQMQVLTTVPQMNYADNPYHATAQTALKTKLTADMRVMAKLAGLLPKPLNMAQNGQFDFKSAIIHAISQAKDYIYVEDQAFQSLELMSAIYDQIRSQNNLKVIFVFGNDPSDDATISRELLPASIDKLLGIGGANPLTPAQVSRIAFFSAFNLNSPGNHVIHSKVVIIDDIWASIGSANFMRRSLAMDIELAVGIAGDPSNSFAKKLRCDLWASLTNPGISTDFVNVQKSLKIWDTSWGIPGDGQSDDVPPGTVLHSWIKRKSLPFAYSNNTTPADNEWSASSIPFTVETYDSYCGDSTLIF